MQDEQPKIEQRFEPLDLQYKALKNFDVTMEPAELLLKESLLTAWANFRQCLVESDQMLKQKKAFTCVFNDPYSIRSVLKLTWLSL